MTNKILFPLFSCCFILLGLFTIPTAEAQSSPAKTDILKIGTMDLPPYGWIDKYGQQQGIIYEMNQEIGIRSAIPFTNKIYPFKRLLKMLKNGEIDLISSQAHQAAMAAGDKLAIQFKINVIAGTKKGSDIRSVADFKDKFMVYHHAASYHQLDGLPREIQRVNSYRQALQILHIRPIADGAVFSEPAYYYWMKDLGLTPNDFGPTVMIEQNKEQWIFVRKDLPESTRQTLRQVVKDIYQENMYEQLLKKYKGALNK